MPSLRHGPHSLRICGCRFSSLTTSLSSPSPPSSPPRHHTRRRARTRTRIRAPDASRHSSPHPHHPPLLLATTLDAVHTHAHAHVLSTPCTHTHTRPQRCARTRKQMTCRHTRTQVCDMSSTRHLALARTYRHATCCRLYTAHAHTGTWHVVDAVHTQAHDEASLSPQRQDVVHAPRQQFMTHMHTHARGASSTLCTHRQTTRRRCRLNARMPRTHMPRQRPVTHHTHAHGASSTPGRRARK